MGKIGRNIVPGWMVSLLGCTRKNPLVTIVVTLVLASTATWEGKNGVGLLASAAGPEVRAGSDTWRQDHQREVRAAILFSAVAPRCRQTAAAAVSRSWLDRLLGE